jgi:hypothetical protein
MTRINALSSMKDTNSMTWGKTISAHAGVLIFAAVLIVCSVTVGCSSDKPQPAGSNNPIPVTPPQQQAAVVPMHAPLEKPASKPVQRKAPKKPATVNYTDKTYGVTFEYPRRYAIETGDAAAELLLSHPIPMNFVEPGGVALAAVELPETNYNNTDFSSAFFNVSVNKTLTADQCSQFSVPQPKVSEVKTAETKIVETKIVEEKPAEKMEAKSEPVPSAAATEVAKQDSTAAPKPDVKPDAQSTSPSQTCHSEDRASCGTKDPMPAVVTSGSSGSPQSSATQATSDPNSKLMLGDLTLRSTEAVSGEGTRQSDSKYFHVYQNGACYEFALNVTTDASEEGIVKHVDRDKVFSRLGQILSTVKINPVAQSDQTAEVPTPAAAVSPAQ